MGSKHTIEWQDNNTSGREKKSDFHMPKNLTGKINHEGSIDELKFVKITNLGSLKDHILNLLRY